MFMLRKVIQVNNIVVKRSLLKGYFAEREKYWSGRAVHDKQVAQKHLVKEGMFLEKEKEIHSLALAEWDKAEIAALILSDHINDPEYHESYQPEIIYHNESADYMYQQSLNHGKEAGHYHELRAKKLKSAGDAALKAKFYRNMPLYLQQLETHVKEMVDDYLKVYNSIPGITAYNDDNDVKWFFDSAIKEIRANGTESSDWAQRIYMGTKVASTIRHLNELLPAIKDLAEKHDKESLDELKKAFKRLEHIKHWKASLEGNYIYRRALNTKLGKIWEILKLLR